MDTSRNALAMAWFGYEMTGQGLEDLHVPKVEPYWLRNEGM